MVLCFRHGPMVPSSGVCTIFTVEPDTLALNCTHRPGVVASRPRKIGRTETPRRRWWTRPQRLVRSTQHTWSSLTVILPLWSWSIALNRRFMPLISSADRHEPTTISAVFFRRSIPANFFMRDSTTLSSGLSDPAPSCFSHGCCRISEHDGLHAEDL